MKRILLTITALAGLMSLSVSAQENDLLESSKSLKFYGIDFVTAKVVGADEPASEFIEAFKGINNLFVSEPDKYVNPLESRLKKKIESVNLDYALDLIETIDGADLKINRSAKELTDDDILYELQDLGIEPSEGLGLVIMAGEINKGTDYGTFYYVFFDNKTMDVLSVMPYQGKSGGIGLRNYWARSFYRTIFEINPTKFYQSKKKIKSKVDEGVDAVKGVFE